MEEDASPVTTTTNSVVVNVETNDKETSEPSQAASVDNNADNVSRTIELWGGDDKRYYNIINGALSSYVICCDQFIECCHARDL